MRITGKLWKQNNKEKVRLQGRVAQSKRKARLRNAEGSYTQADVELQHKSQRGKCWWCGDKIKGTYHVDHRIAISRGGTNWPNNICISCQHCNESKHNKMPWEWNGRLL
jgi:5-methylcytosine-specific restriction endonuclease McrA